MSNFEVGEQTTEDRRQKLTSDRIWCKFLCSKEFCCLSVSPLGAVAERRPRSVPCGTADLRRSPKDSVLGGEKYRLARCIYQAEDDEADGQG